MQNFINYIFHQDSKTGLITRHPITKEERIALIERVNKYPGEQNLDERIWLANNRARTFLNKGYYVNVVPKSRDYISFWETEKQIIYGGLLIDNEFYIPGDHYWYLNYIFIPDKVKKIDTFPRIFDTDIWWYQLIELANLTGEFTATVKKRQMGFSLKAVARVTKRFWFEQGFVGRIIAWDEKYVKDSWSIFKLYSKNLNRNTAWKRPITGEKMDITQEIKMEDGTYRGLGSKLQGLTFKTNPSKVVGGKVDEYLWEEAGAAPNADVVIELADSALKFGNLTTGNFHGIGAVTELKNCKPLKDIIYNPKDNGFLAMPNIHSNRPEEKVGIFVPEKYSYGDCIDQYGNSLIKEAEIEIAKAEEKMKKKSYKSFMVYKSQHPNTLEDAFASREENDFPVDIIQPWYDYLCQNYNPLTVTISEEPHGLTHNLGSKHDIVEDFPIKKDTNKNGAIVIDEAPIHNPPFGLYYAGVDTITPIKSTVSKSLQSIYIYKAAHELDGEYTQDKAVAWYAGRADNPYDTYKATRDLIKYYNCRALIENDNRNFIEWMIGQKCQQYMMKRNEIALGKDLIARSSIDTSEYGSRTQNIKPYLIGLLIAYCEEEIGVRFDKKTGKSSTIYGVERIKDKMLLLEMLNYTPKTNVDRCFPATEMVQTKDGFKSIEDIELGELVRTHKGNLRPVTELISNPYKGENYQIKVLGVDTPIECTPNHPFYTAWSTTPRGCKPTGKSWHHKFRLNHKEWINAKDLEKGQYLLIPKRQGLEETNLTWFEMYLLGWYLSDGYIKYNTETSGRCTITFQENQLHIAEFIKHELEDRFIESKRGIQSPTIKKIPNVKAYKLGFTSNKFIKLVEKCTYSKDAKSFNYKTLKPEIYNKSNLLPLILGFLEGDGHQKSVFRGNSQRHVLEVSSINQNLIYQVRQILIDHGIWSTCNLSSQNKRRGYKQQWRLDIQDWEGINKLVENSLKFKPININRKQKKHHIEKEEGFWCPIKNIKKVEYDGIVYNLEVEEDHSYTVKHIATHNCMAMCITLLAAKSNTNRGIKVKSKSSYETPRKAVNYSKRLSRTSLMNRGKIRNTFLK